MDFSNAKKEVALMKAAKVGVFSALVASICCVGPLVVLALGLGSLGLGAIFGRFHWVFIAAAMVILTAAWVLYRKESRRCEAAHCEMEGRKLARTTLLLATIAVAFFLGLNLYTYTGPGLKAESTPTAGTPQEAQVILAVDGMTCFTCELAVEQALKRLDGVEQAEARATEKSVTVLYDPRKVKVDELIAAVSRTGYRVRAPEKPL